MCDTWQSMCPHACQWRNLLKEEGNQFVEEESNKKEWKKKKREEKKREKEGEKEISVPTRATLQEVGILHTLVYFSP